MKRMMTVVIAVLAALCLCSCKGPDTDSMTEGQNDNTSGTTCTDASADPDRSDPKDGSPQSNTAEESEGESSAFSSGDKSTPEESRESGGYESAVTGSDASVSSVKEEGNDRVILRDERSVLSEQETEELVKTLCGTADEIKFNISVYIGAGRNTGETGQLIKAYAASDDKRLSYNGTVYIYVDLDGEEHYIYGSGYAYLYYPPADGPDSRTGRIQRLMKTLLPFGGSRTAKDITAAVEGCCALLADGFHDGAEVGAASSAEVSRGQFREYEVDGKKYRIEGSIPLPGG